MLTECTRITHYTRRRIHAEIGIHRVGYISVSWDPGEILTPDAPIICAKMENISRTIGKKIDYRGRTYCDDTQSRSSLEKFIMPSTNPFIPVLPTFLMIVGVTTRTPRILMRKAWSYNVFAAHAIHQPRSYIPSQPLKDKRANVITASYETPVLYSS